MNNYASSLNTVELIKADAHPLSLTKGQNVNVGIDSRQSNASLGSSHYNSDAASRTKANILDFDQY